MCHVTAVGQRNMARFLLLFVAAAFVVVSSLSHDNVFVQAKKTTEVIKCSCTIPSPAAHHTNKVLTKSAKCQVGASYMVKNKCCAKAAKPSQDCKYHAPPAPPPTRLGAINPAPGTNCDHPSCAGKANSNGDCGYGEGINGCNTATGSVCINLSGGATKQRCTCNSVADCPFKEGLPWSCTKYSGSGDSLPHTYQGNICVAQDNDGWHGPA